MRIVVFEDSKACNFLPLTYTRAAFDLKVGAASLLDRIRRVLGRVDVVIVRDYLADVYSERLEGVEVNPRELDGDALMVNARALLDDKLASLVRERLLDKRYFAVVSGRDVALAYIPPGIVDKALSEIYDRRELRATLMELERLEYGATMIEYPWELVKLTASLLASELGSQGDVKGDVDPRAVIYGCRAYISEGAVVDAYAVIDSRGGPVYIGEGAHVKAGAVIEGPAYIGEGTVVSPHSYIRSGCSIGRYCHVGGELKEVVMMDYSNKGHEGFLGRAYVGEWVNLGALTSNSDLKDTYGTVRVNVCGARVDTGLVKVGCFIGDMAKTSIGTLIYTGKRVGVASHLHGVVYEDVPSFTIYAKSLGAEPVELYLESAIETQRRVMRRRNKELTRAEEELIRRVYELTEEERRAAGVRKGRLSLP